MKNWMNTKRVISIELENILYERINVLDHGFIRVIDYMGNDNSIVQAARVSYGNGTKKVSEDKALINYLMRNNHTSPFEMCEIKFHIKLPIFVARQWIRHRTASVNEYSARYSKMEGDFYIPKKEDLSTQSSVNKQGRSSEMLSEIDTDKTLSIFKNDSQNCYDHYINMLEYEPGLSREIARINLTLNTYTEWYWKINLHNLLHFLELRIDSHAQHEIRQYANIILGIVEKWVPYTHSAFIEYRLYGYKISKTSMNVIKSMLKGESISQENSGLSKREWNELLNSLS